jgi:integrase/recombinase XerD
MSRTYEYRSGLASQISAFIAEKRACGCKYEKEAKTFQTLDRFLVEQGINTPVLPELVVEKWIEKRPNEKRKNQKWRLNFTKRFAKYLQLNGYAAYYPELTISSRDDADFSPCIFTSAELARIMKYFETMVPSRQCPTAHLVFHADLSSFEVFGEDALHIFCQSVQLQLFFFCHDLCVEFCRDHGAEVLFPLHRSCSFL